MIEFNENLNDEKEIILKKENIVNHPNHYADTKYECRPVACEIFKDFTLCEIMELEAKMEELIREGEQCQ